MFYRIDPIGVFRPNSRCNGMGLVIQLYSGLKLTVSIPVIVRIDSPVLTSYGFKLVFSSKREVLERRPVQKPVSEKYTV